ncbi:MAG: 30S ribosomal protein S17 [Candidatus Woesearchaeota archaeon]
MKGKNIGYGIPVPPEPKVADANDPFYGSVKIKRNNFTARVVSDKAMKTAVVAVDRSIFNKKYQRFEKKRSAFSVHNPASIAAKEGDVVRVFETRPLSKSKHHVIVQVVGHAVDIQGQDLEKESKEEKA